MSAKLSLQAARRAVRNAGLDYGEYVRAGRKFTICPRRDVLIVPVDTAQRYLSAAAKRAKERNK